MTKLRAIHHEVHEEHKVLKAKTYLKGFMTLRDPWWPSWLHLYVHSPQSAQRTQKLLTILSF